MGQDMLSIDTLAVTISMFNHLSLRWAQDNLFPRSGPFPEPLFAMGSCGFTLHDVT